MNKSIKSFTLAEVLITLVIIGVIAAMTVPTIMQNTQKQEIISKLKKADSVLRQSLYNISRDTGYPVGDYSFTNNDEFFDLFAKKLNVAKMCGSANQGCFSDVTYSLKGEVWSNYNSYSSNSKTFVTTDGIAYGWSKTLCTTDKGLLTEDYPKCLGRFIIDVNGSRKPNAFGRDVFFFTVVDRKGIVAAGSGNNSADCKKNSSGITCAAKVLKEGKFTY